MDGLVFTKLMFVLNRNLIGAKLNKISVAGDSVFFSFFLKNPVIIEFRASPAPPAIFSAPVSMGETFGVFNSISGSSVSSIKSFGYERAGYIELKKRRPSGKLVTYKAVIEPAGNYANMFLLDENDVILYSLSSRTIDPDRNIGTGGVYTVPRPNKKFSLDFFKDAVSFSELAGFYPVTSRYADKIAEKNDFIYTAAYIKEHIINDDVFYIDSNNKVIPFPVDNYIKTVDWLELAGFYPVKKKDNVSGVKERLKKYFSSKMDKYLRLAEKLENELSNAKKYNLYLEEAELIKANLYKVKGSGNYIFERYDEQGVTKVSYKLEYGENLNLKADRLYKKAARLKKSIPLIEEHLDESMQIALSAEEQLYYLDNSDIQEAAAFENIISSENRQKNRKTKSAIKKNFYEKIYQNYKIYAGKSASSNYELVFRHGIDTDMWFHARNIPSAHVLLRVESGVRITDDMIEECASIAAALSKYKFQDKVDVDYTLKKYVNKPKDTPVGFVTYKRFKTITVRPIAENDVKILFGINA